MTKKCPVYESEKQLAADGWQDVMISMPSKGDSFTACTTSPSYKIQKTWNCSDWKRTDLKHFQVSFTYWKKSN